MTSWLKGVAEKWHGECARADAVHLVDCVATRVNSVQAYLVMKPVNFGQLFLMKGMEFFKFSGVHVS